MIKLKDLLLKEYTNHFRGWISPDGEEHHFYGQTTDDVDDTHNLFADKLLTKFYPNWNWRSNKRFEYQGAIFAEEALSYKGWIRVVDNGIYSIYQLTPQIKNILIELLSELPENYPVTLDIEEGHRSFHHSTAKEVLDWMENI